MMGTVARMRTARAFARLDRMLDSGRSCVRIALKCVTASSSSALGSGYVQSRLIAARIPKRWPNAPRGGSPVGTSYTEKSFFVARSANIPPDVIAIPRHPRSEEHTSELQSQSNLVCRLLLEKKKKKVKTLWR